jgi:hypothetical protein
VHSILCETAQQLHDGVGVRLLSTAISHSAIKKNVLLAMVKKIETQV